MRSILILEDNPTASEWLESAIQRYLADLNPRTEVLETEAEFVHGWVREFDQGGKRRPDLIVIDIMLRWTDPAPDQPPRPPEVIEGGFTKAGLRCLDLIRHHRALSQSRVILFTVLSQEDLKGLGKPGDVEVLRKGDGQKIIESIRTVLEAQPHA
jgi:CheY-like chemotaxis protein